MNLSTVFDRVRHIQGRQQQDAQTRYRGLVADLSAGNDLDAEAVRDVLDAAGKTVTDLENDVQRVQERKSLAAQLAAAEKAAKAAVKLQQRLETLRQERAGKLREMDAEIAKLAEEVRAIERLAAGVEQLRYKLVESNADPELQAREEQTIEQRKTLVPQLRDADAQCRFLEARCRSLETELGNGGSRWLKLVLPNDIGAESDILRTKRHSLDRCRRELKQALAERDRLQKEFARLGDVIDSIQAAKLNP